MSAIPKPWTDTYLRNAIRDEIGLARLMGFTVAMPGVITAVTELIPTQKRGYRFLAPTSSHGALPAWRRNWNAAGPLIGELGLRVLPDDEDGSVSAGTGGRRNVTERYEEHPSRDAAIMAAIVRAAILALEARVEQ